MSRVGIITLYYNNDNYGGIAQAYALCEQIKKMGHEPELISYQYTPSQKRSKLDKIKEKGIFQLINDRMIYLPKLVIQKMGNKIAKKKYGKDAAKDIELRKKAFAESRDRISHSSVYTEDIMEDCVERYDIFVSGSDQIWKTGVVQGPYVLSFVPDGKKRFSYESSIAVTTLDEAYGEYMKEALWKYSCVSVREKASKNIWKIY